MIVCDSVSVYFLNVCDALCSEPFEDWPWVIPKNMTYSCFYQMMSCLSHLDTREYSIIDMFGSLTEFCEMSTITVFG